MTKTQTAMTADVDQIVFQCWMFLVDAKMTAGTNEYGEPSECGVDAHWNAETGRVEIGNDHGALATFPLATAVADTRDWVAAQQNAELVF